MVRQAQVCWELIFGNILGVDVLKLRTFSECHVGKNYTCRYNHDEKDAMFVKW